MIGSSKGAAENDKSVIVAEQQLAEESQEERENRLRQERIQRQVNQDRVRREEDLEFRDKDEDQGEGEQHIDWARAGMLRPQPVQGWRKPKTAAAAATAHIKEAPHEKTDVAEGQLDPSAPPPPSGSSSTRARPESSVASPLLSMP